MAASAAVAYAAFGLAWVHGDVDPLWDAVSDAEAVALFVAIHAIVGGAVGRWEAAFLPAIPLAGGVALAIAGYEGAGVDPIPAWFLPLLYLPLELAAVAAGVAGRRRFSRKLAA